MNDENDDGHNEIKCLKKDKDDFRKNPKIKLASITTEITLVSYERGNHVEAYGAEVEPKNLCELAYLFKFCP